MFHINKKKKEKNHTAGTAPKS